MVLPALLWRDVGTLCIDSGYVKVSNRKGCFLQGSYPGGKMFIELGMLSVCVIQILLGGGMLVYALLKKPKGDAQMYRRGGLILSSSALPIAILGVLFSSRIAIGISFLMLVVFLMLQFRALRLR